MGEPGDRRGSDLPQHLGPPDRAASLVNYDFPSCPQICFQIKYRCGRGQNKMSPCRALFQVDGDRSSLREHPACDVVSEVQRPRGHGSQGEQRTQPQYLAQEPNPGRWLSKGPQRTRRVAVDECPRTLRIQQGRSGAAGHRNENSITTPLLL